MSISTSLPAYAAALAICLSPMLGAAPAVASPPPANDTPYGTVSMSMPYTTTVDTSGATTDEYDVMMNAQCQAPATDASLWYSFNSTPNVGVRLRATGDFGPGLIVMANLGGSLEFVTCSTTPVDGTTEVDWMAGSNIMFYVLAFDSDGLAPTGGSLTLALDRAPQVAPVARNQAFLIDVNSWQGLGVGLDARDANGDPLAFVIDSTPAHGSLIGDCTTGVCTYLPAAGYAGPDSFTWHATDGTADSAQATCSFVMDHFPVAVDDSISTIIGVAGSVAVVANDTDADGDALGFDGISSQPVNGTAECNAAGLCTYTPAAEYVGSDEFTYTIRDPFNGYGIGTVYVDVTAAESPPVITLQPSDQRVGLGLAAIFTTEASGSQLSVGWEVSTDHGATWSTVPGANSAALTLPSVTRKMDGRQYRATYTNALGATTTDTATLTVATAFTVTATSGAGGRIKPSGSVAVKVAASKTFVMRPSRGHHVSEVLVDGEPIGPVSAYTFTQVTGDHWLHVTFAPNT